MKIAKDSKITLLGLGLSNYGMALFLYKYGFKNVFISESNEKNEFYAKIKDFPFEFEFGKHTEKKVLDSDIILISPGISPDNPMVKKAEKQGIEIITDVEFVYRIFPNKKYIAITGSNGKSTTTALLYHIFKSCEMNATMGGNIGIPIGEVLCNDSDKEYFIWELSSYQLERCKLFKPTCAIFLNISENHLYHHKTMQNYMESKLNIFSNSDLDNTAVFSESLVKNSDAELNIIFNNALNKFKGKKLSFGFSKDNTCFFENNTFYYKNTKIFENKGLPLIGKHNLENIMAVLLTSIEFGLNIFDIEKAVKSFTPLPHRLEFIIKNENITIVNDSKSTTIVSLIKALESFDKKVILLAGGYDKGMSLEPLKEVLKNKVKKAILFGKAKDRFFDYFSQYVTSMKANDVRNAFYKSVEIADKGDIILFSPACASFDEFKNFEKRGEYFKDIVENYMKNNIFMVK